MTKTIKKMKKIISVILVLFLMSCNDVQLSNFDTKENFDKKEAVKNMIAKNESYKKYMPDEHAWLLKGDHSLEEIEEVIIDHVESKKRQSNLIDLHNWKHKCANKDELIKTYRKFIEEDDYVFLHKGKIYSASEDNYQDIFKEYTDSIWDNEGDRLERFYEFKKDKIKWLHN